MNPSTSALSYHRIQALVHGRLVGRHLARDTHRGGARLVLRGTLLFQQPLVGRALAARHLGSFEHRAHWQARHRDGRFAPLAAIGLVSLLHGVAHDPSL